MLQIRIQEELKKLRNILQKTWFEGKFPFKVVDIHKTEIKNPIAIIVFDYENKEKYLIYASKNCF